MIPQHIGIILDGNRRFAKELMKKPWIGHKYGLKKAREALAWACKKGIKYMTAYALSLENIKNRPEKELSLILKYLEKECDDMLHDKNHPIHKYSVNVRFIGRIRLLPNKLRQKIKKVENMTKKYKKHFLNIAVAYGGQQEIVDATKKIIRDVVRGKLDPSRINERVISKNLWTNGCPEPDMILRTGGEKRLSNFLPFQSAYSELIFVNKKWPEMREKDFDAALREFENRKRRFGS